MENALKLNDIPKNKRPRERMIMFGAEALNEEELMALILRSGTKGENVLALSKRLLDTLGGVKGIANTNLKELSNIKGIKEARALQILAMKELIRRYYSFDSLNEIKVNSPKLVFDNFRYEMEELKNEILKVIMLNSKNIIISVRDIFKGGLNSSVAHPREIFHEALKCSAASIIVCHNHPSGDPTPSKDDISTTKRIKECSKFIGIELVDHIIFGKKSYVSLREQGII